MFEQAVIVRIWVLCVRAFVGKVFTANYRLYIRMVLASRANNIENLQLTSFITSFMSLCSNLYFQLLCFQHYVILTLC